MDTNPHSRVDLKNQLFLLIVVPVLLVELVISGLALYLQQQDLHKQFLNEGQLLLAHYKLEVSHELHQLENVNHSDIRLKQVLRESADKIINEDNVRAAHYFVTDAKGEVNSLAHAGPRMRPKDNQYATRMFSRNSHRFKANIETKNKTGPILLEIELDHQILQIRSYQSILLMAATMLLSVIIILLYANYSASRVSAPIRAISHAIARIREGQLSTRVKSRVPRGELHELIEGVNTMAASLQEAHEELQSSVDQATEDLRSTLETIEIQNIELDFARKEAEQASRIKSQFLANISHEIRTPLNSIIGFTNLLLKSKLEEKQKDQIQTILKSSENLLAIINDILDVSKIEAGKLHLDVEEVELRQLLNEVKDTLAPLAKEKNLEQQVYIDDAVPITIYSDRLRIQQVLTNLVNNAIKFSDQGKLFIQVSMEANKSSETLIKFSVKDQGVGLSEAAKEKLFDAFHQSDTSNIRRFQGTGLGLTISRHLVELLGGEIGVDSTLGEGSTFWFTLPCNTQYKPSKPVQELSPEAERSPGIAVPKILAVDDNPANLKLLCALLEDIGVDFEASASGREAIEKNKVNDYDLIFMDIQMPDMDGIEATRQIREYDKRFNKHHAIIALTAHALDEEQQSFLDQGFNHCLTKPIDTELLINTIEHWTGFSPVIKNELENTPGLVINQSTSIDINEGLRLSGNKAQLADEMLEMLVNTLEQDMAEINHLYDCGDHKSLLDKVHYIHGACRYCGVPLLRTASANMETALKKGETELITYIEQMQTQVNKLLKEYQQSTKPIHA